MAVRAMANRDDRALLEAAWARLDSPPLNSVFVLKTDLARLAVTWLFGGWWLDADAVCIDNIRRALHCPAGAVQQAVRAAIRKYHSSCKTSPLTGREMLRSTQRRKGHEETLEAGCVFAWEGDVRSDPSSPLQWAFGCQQGAAFALAAMRMLAKKVLAWHHSSHTLPNHEFMARSSDGATVDVLSLTGPAMVAEALRQYHGASLRELREGFGEAVEDEATWARVSIVAPENNTDSSASVVMLPYCFFRSRGCRHNQDAYRDTVLFHHEFDTSWRQAYWHNYFKPEPHGNPRDSRRYSPGC